MSIQGLVSKSLETLRQEMFDNLTAKQEEYAAKGWLPIRLNLNKGIVRGLIEMWCWGLWQLYQFLALVLNQAFPDKATGLWLELHCRQVGVNRKPATQASGLIYLCRDADGGNVAIPAGRIVRTKPDATGTIYRYVTTAAAVLPAGSLDVAVPAIAEEYGASSNATAGQISEIVTVIPGVDFVENRLGWLISEGADQEGDDSLRLRYQLAWKLLSGCTKYAYEAWALEVPGVVSVKIQDQHPRGEGTVDVIIVGAAGIPTEGLIDLVKANIIGTGNGDEKNPINDDVEIIGPTPVNIVYVAELEITSGDPVSTIADAEKRIRALFSIIQEIDGINPLTVGQDCTQDRLKWACMLPNVKRINTAFTDTAIAGNELAVLETLTITAVVAAEI